MNKRYVVKHTGTNDYIFKTIFQNPEILSSYLKLLDIDIPPSEIIYQNVESKKDLHFKSVRFDIRIQAAHTRLDIEGQRGRISGRNKEGKKVSSKTYQDRRKIHYLCQLHSEAYAEGERYFEERKSKVIFFLDYDIKGDNYIQRTRMINGTTKEIYEDIEIIEIALKKVKEDATLKSRMLKVLTKTDITEYYEEEGTVGGVAKMIYELNAEEREKNIKRYEADMRREEGAILEAKYYDGYYDGKDEGERKGKKAGILLGKKKNALDTAKRLKAMGSTDEFISEATGLSIEKVKSL